MEWANRGTLISRKFKCGYCGSLVASNHGYSSNQHGTAIYICPHCTEPSYFTPPDRQIPGIAAGDDVSHLPADIKALYQEARNCVAANAYTAAVLTCRKLLMNIGVAQKAEEGQNFIAYVEYLASQGYVPPNGRAWVDHIRTKGNEANHEIVLMSKQNAEELISFIEMLLKFIYEFPARVPAT
jgi:hypothetical protein